MKLTVLTVEKCSIAFELDRCKWTKFIQQITFSEVLIFSSRWKTVRFKLTQYTNHFSFRYRCMAFRNLCAFRFWVMKNIRLSFQLCAYWQVKISHQVCGRRRKFTERKKTRNRKSQTLILMNEKKINIPFAFYKSLKWLLPYWTLYD